MPCPKQKLTYSHQHTLFNPSSAQEVTDSAGKIVLFIDEIHTVVGAGATGGAMDASNLLKPMLGRGELRCIGATTLDEYRKYIEKDPALERYESREGVCLLSFVFLFFVERVFSVVRACVCRGVRSFVPVESRTVLPHYRRAARRAPFSHQQLNNSPNKKNHRPKQKNHHPKKTPKNK
jgi:hypothetical protein